MTRRRADAARFVYTKMKTLELILLDANEDVSQNCFECELLQHHLQ